MIPLSGPLHVSLNSRETCIKNFFPFFNGLYLYLAHSGWVEIRDEMLDIFQKSKNIGLRTIIELLDNLIPAVLDVYISVAVRNSKISLENFQNSLKLV